MILESFVKRLLTNSKRIVMADEKIRLENELSWAEIELSYITQTIQQVKLMTDELPTKTTAYEELNIFKQKLELKKEIEQTIKDEIEGSIIWLKNKSEVCGGV